MHHLRFVYVLWYVAWVGKYPVFYHVLPFEFFHFSSELMKTLFEDCGIFVMLQVKAYFIIVLYIWRGLVLTRFVYLVHTSKLHSVVKDSENSFAHIMCGIGIMNLVL
jgi:hypothetical protein